MQECRLPLFNRDIDPRSIRRFDYAELEPPTGEFSEKLHFKFI